MTYNLCKKLLARLGLDKDGQEVLGGIILVIFWLTALATFIHGAAVANNDKHCRLRSIGDVIASPFYALGCNIAKDRFDQKIN